MQQPQEPGMQQLPGAEFFESRLQRAQAVPPAERSPEVQAFIESVQLLRSIPELLPVTSSNSGNGRPAPVLPLTAPATQERFLQAMLAVARAFYVCPKPPVCDIDPLRYLYAYGRPSQQGCYGFLAKVLTAYHGSQYCHIHTAQRLGGLQCARQALQLFSSPGNLQAINDQLQQLADSQGQQEPLLSVQQLQYAFCCAFSETAALLRHDASMGHIDAAQLAEVQAAEEYCCKELVRLDPGNPKSWDLSSLMAEPQDRHRAAKMSLRAIQLAQQQGCDFWVASLSCRAVMLLVRCMSEDWGLDLMKTMNPVLEAYQQAGAALSRCKRMLPELWVRPLESQLLTAQSFVHYIPYPHRPHRLSIGAKQFRPVC